MRQDPGTPLVEAIGKISPVPGTPIINKFNRLNPPSKHGFLFMYDRTVFGLSKEPLKPSTLSCKNLDGLIMNPINREADQ